MLAYILTLLSPILGGGFALYGSKLSEGQFFSKNYTSVLKGLCCLIVIYVHVKEGYGNKLQDAIGSFAYCCVTIFFLVSAYGMMLSAERKGDYLKGFWRNRLLALLVPSLVVNIVGCVAHNIFSDDFSLKGLYQLNNYVAVLLLWCVWFYIVEWCKAKWFKDNTRLGDVLLIVGVVASSLYGYFDDPDPIKTGAFSGWPYERMGLVWGVLLYRYFHALEGWMAERRMAKVMVLTILGGVLGVAYLKYKMVFFWGAYLLKVVLGFTLILLLFTLTSNRAFGNKVSLWLGNISYEVYLSHGIVMGVLVHLLAPEVNSGVFILLTVVLTLILSHIEHAIATPIVRRLRSK